MIEYDKFKMALKHLELQYENYRNIDKKLPSITKEAISESVVQRFETCYDCMWKVLKRYLVEVLGSPDDQNSPKKTFHLANENGLLPSSIESFLEYADARIGTSHDYSGEKASKAIDLVKDFIDDAIGLYQTMTGKVWE